MKIVGYFMLVFVLLAILQSLAFVASVLDFIVLLWGVCFRTRETFGLMAAFLLLGIACSSSGPSIMVAGAVLVWLALTRRPDPGGG